MTNGKRVYPMIHIDWKKELAIALAKSAKYNARGNSHVPSQQLDLHCHNGFPNPYQSKDPGEDNRFLLARCSHRQQQTQKKAEY